GMTGDYNSCIGMIKDEPLSRFIRRIPSSKFEPALGPATLCGLAVETDDSTGLAQRVAAVRLGGRLEEARPAFWDCNHKAPLRSNNPAPSPAHIPRCTMTGADGVSDGNPPTVGRTNMSDLQYGSSHDLMQGFVSRRRLLGGASAVVGGLAVGIIPAPAV